ncbi:MAG: gliding motility-associated C-terminal domain-containing protein [Bacteroidetes bacterium]|nr:gliding motility-associated C-terminal domain-containing protein [Bacteroidota bacterium]
MTLHPSRNYHNTKPAAARWLILLLFICIQGSRSFAQDCPPNIDFEKGDFSNWTCYVGQVVGAGGLNIITLSPVSGPMPDQHTIYSRNSGEVDYFGGFPVVCPNGSGYAVKLGNTTGGAQAEGLSYEFTIPSDRNTYSLIYNYAVVFQDPSHLEFQQPRLELEVTNVTDNELITCSSFTFFPNGSPLPGFFQSPNYGGDTTPVWCKDWTAVSISLNGKAGKTIRLMFKTADCTFRRHFGYAYIDVNSECSSEFTGATYCPDDREVVLTAPYGYQNYIWHDNAFTTILGSGQTLHLAPPPPPGTIIAVELLPYEGYGCRDTLYAHLIDTLKLKAKAGEDKVFCNGSPPFIGDYTRSNVVYNWTPATGLSNPTISSPRASPTVTTEYILHINSIGGGCNSEDTVIVTPIIVDTAMQFIGKRNYCITSGDSAVLQVTHPPDSVQWYRNNAPISGAHGLRYRVSQSGQYKAQLFDKRGCNEFTRTEDITIEVPRPGVRYPLEYSVINIPIELRARDFGEEYTWQPALNLSDANILNPIFNSLLEAEITYRIRITTAAGCVTIDTQSVKTVKEVKIYVPTGFTPNNDGRNDYFYPILIGIRQLHYFRVYNRWGQLVYDMPPGHRGWDGMLKGIQQNPDVYIWMVEGLGADKKVHFQKGTVMLIR